MKLVFEDLTERQVKKRETVSFFVEVSSVYLIEISARAKGEKQLGGSDDEDLKVEIDRQSFPILSGQSRYFDSPAAFSGGKLHGLSKSVFFFVPLTDGLHEIVLTADISATLERIQVYQIDVREEPFFSSITAEDGDRRPWLTFVFLGVHSKAFSLSVNLQKRFLDSDDVKVVVDGSTKRNYRSILRKFWYFVASAKGGEQSANFDTNFVSGLHYVELWADRMPTLNKIIFWGLSSAHIEPKDATEIIKDKIRFKARKYVFDEEMMLRLAKKESQFNPKAVSPAEAKGIFQLTPITLEQIRNLEYQINDVFDVDQNIEGAMIYFRWLRGLYHDGPELLEKTLIAWNWGQKYISRTEPLNWLEIPDSVKAFVKEVLGK